MGAIVAGPVGGFVGGAGTEDGAPVVCVLVCVLPAVFNSLTHDGGKKTWETPALWSWPEVVVPVVPVDPARTPGSTFRDNRGGRGRGGGG